MAERRVIYARRFRFTALCGGRGVDYAFSPDSREIAFLRNPDKVEAISTNSDIYVVPRHGGDSKNITVRNRGYDDGPVYTKDGKYILYLSQARRVSKQIVGG